MVTAAIPRNVSLLIGLFSILIACGRVATDDDGEDIQSTIDPNSPDSEIYFPRAKPLPKDEPSPDGDIRGMLQLVDGCLRVERDVEGASALVLWPAGFDLDVSGESVSVLDPGGVIVARVGDPVELAGGMYAESGDVEFIREWLNERMETPIPDVCSAPFWLVGHHPLPPSE